MKTRNFRNRLPALYRWSRRRRYLPYAALIACAIVFLPLGIVGGVKITRIVTTNNALAATRAVAPEHSVFDVMSESERERYAGTLSNLVIDDPETLYQLIGHDFLVMFKEPDLKRQEGRMAIWQYRTVSCVLDIYFEQAVGDTSGGVAHYEVRQRKLAAFGVEGQHEGNVDKALCLEALYEQRSI